MALDLAAADPLQFASALQSLIDALQAPHPSLLAVLLNSGLAEPSSGKVCSLPCSASQALHIKVAAVPMYLLPDCCPEEANVLALPKGPPAAKIRTRACSQTLLLPRASLQV